MLEMEVLEESHSEWSSPVVLVPKLGRTVRFCSYIWGLNEVRKFYAYPMPSRMNCLGKASYDSTLDLMKRCWQVSLTAASRKKTAFSTPGVGDRGEVGAT